MSFPTYRHSETTCKSDFLIGLILQIDIGISMKLYLKILKNSIHNPELEFPQISQMANLLHSTNEKEVPGETM